jgi:hypothetical protein
MSRSVAAAVAALATLTGLALACGRYGPPHRIAPPPQSRQSVPLTDPAVPR